MSNNRIGGPADAEGLPPAAGGSPAPIDRHVFPDQPHDYSCYDNVPGPSGVSGGHSETERGKTPMPPGGAGKTE